MLYWKLRFWFFLLLMLGLTILPLPGLISLARPPWVLLLILYVQFYLTTSFNLTFVFFTGLCLDVLLASVIGEHVFALSMITWMASSRVKRFHFFSSAQQIMLIGLLCFFFQFTTLLINAFLGFHYILIMPVMSAFISMLLWPWFKLFADHIFFPIASVLKQ